MAGALLGIGLLFLLLMIGAPMLVALLAAVMVSFTLGGQWGIIIPQSMVSGVSSFTLVALPLFVLAGILMNAGGISGRIFDFARSLVGWMRGGLAQINVLMSIFFGGMVGSSTADLVGSGSILIPQMKKEGYPAADAAAVTASASGIGPLIPPSSPLILYSAVTGTSLGTLFLAGLIPGLLLGGVLMITVAIVARRQGWKSHAAFSWDKVIQSGGRSLLAFGLPVIIIGGLAAGWFTPSEAGAFGVVYAMFLSLFVYRWIGFRELYRVMGAAVQFNGEILLIVGLSYALGTSLSSAHVPAALAGVIEIFTIGESTILILVGIMVLAIIAGMFLDPLIPVFVPIVLPTLLAFNIDLVQFGVLMVMAVVIGQLTPPVAIALIITSKIADCDQIRIFRANMPYFIAILLFTALLILFPGLSTWFPAFLAD